MSGILRSGYQRMVNAIWGLGPETISLANRTVTPSGGTVTTVTTVTNPVTVTGTVTPSGGTVVTVTGNVNGNIGGNLNGSVTGNVGGAVIGDLGGDVIGDVQGNVLGNLNGNIGGNIGGSVAGNLGGAVVGDLGGNVVGDVQGDVVGSVGSVATPVTLAATSPGARYRRITGVTTITNGNTSQTTSLGVTVTELNCDIGLCGSSARSGGDNAYGDGSVEVLDSGNVRVYRTGSTGQCDIRWQLIEVRG